MTDTPTIALYYREHDPMKRKMFLDQSIAAGEDEEANAVRKELWELRYGEPSEAGSGTRADGYLALWMAMEYNKDTAGKLFGLKRARKEIEKNLARLKFREMQEKSELHRELLYRECCRSKPIWNSARRIRPITRSCAGLSISVRKVQRVRFRTIFIPLPLHFRRISTFRNNWK